MENASKALIIAGAILLSILLISLGIIIYNEAQTTVDNSGMSQAEVQSFNNKFMKYEGNIKGSKVKALINEVIVSNQDETTEKIEVFMHQVEEGASYDKNEGTAVTGTSAFSTSKMYEVILSYAGKDGYVSRIDIVETIPKEDK